MANEIKTVDVDVVKENPSAMVMSKSAFDLMNSNDNGMYNLAEVNELIKNVERNKEAIQGLNKAACSCLNKPRYWMDQGGKPMLWGDATSVLATTFGIDFIPVDRDGRPSAEAFIYEVVTDSDGTKKTIVRYTMIAYFKPANRKMMVIGTSDSEHGLYTRGGHQDADSGDLHKHAMANAERRAVTKLLGLASPSWEEVAEWTQNAVTRDKCVGANYKGTTQKTEEAGETVDGKSYDDARACIRDWVLEMCEKDAKRAQEKLFELTSFKNKEGEMVGGRKATKDLTSKQVPIAYGKIKTLYADWQKLQTGEATNSEGEK